MSDDASPSSQRPTSDDDENTDTEISSDKTTKPDVCNNESRAEALPESTHSTSNSQTTHKEDSLLSLRHFLKRDLSLPGTSTYENTGARPKVYSSSMIHHTPTQPRVVENDFVEESIKNKDLMNDVHTENFSANSQLINRHNHSHENHESTISTKYSSKNGEVMSMPSLPDFVQDHILVEQVHNGTNEQEQADILNNGQALVPPLDLPMHLHFDLTESVHQASRRNPFPFDLPSLSDGSINQGPLSSNDAMRLPDFLPIHTAQAGSNPSPEPLSPKPTENDQLQSEIISLRFQLSTERARTGRLERELFAARDLELSLRAQLRAASTSAQLSSPTTQQDQDDNNLHMKIKKLKEEVQHWRGEAERLRSRQQDAAVQLRHATTTADISLRSLLEGLAELRQLSSGLEPAQDEPPPTP